MSAIILKVFVLTAYLGMLALNTLANALPLFNRTTGDISAKYPNLFTPAGFTFSIWAIIYLALLFMVIRLLALPLVSLHETKTTMFVIAFIVSCFLNMLWLVFWHMDRPIASSLILVLLLLSLLVAYQNVDRSNLVLSLPVSLYLGWVSVAVIANITIALKASGINLILPEAFYFVVVLVAALVLCGLIIHFERDILFVLVFNWALFGIFMRQIALEPRWLHLYTGTILFVLLALNVATLIANRFTWYGP